VSKDKKEKTDPKQFLVDILPGLGLGVEFMAMVAVAQVDPTVAALYAGVTTVVSRLNQLKQKTFSREFKSGLKNEIFQEVYRSEQFAKAVLYTLEAVAETDSEDKLKVFARLLRSGVNEKLILDFDSFKEYVKLVDEISPRELLIISIINKHRESVKGGAFGITVNDIELDELGIPKKPIGAKNFPKATRGIVSSSKEVESEMTISKEGLIWLRAKREILQNLKVTEGTLNPLIDRLLRTGLIRKVPIFNTQNTRLENQEQIELTSLFNSLKVYIQKESGGIF
jgi:hypothetical protein